VVAAWADIATSSWDHRWMQFKETLDLAFLRLLGKE
jgi:hypothetical protein